VAAGDLHLRTPPAHTSWPASAATRSRPYKVRAAQRPRASILNLGAQGEGNAAIARELCLRDKTVHTNVSYIPTKIGARERTEAIHLAPTRGLGQPSP
jgi:DNA-binding NarL/FixJ family response regulator